MISQLLMFLELLLWMTSPSSPTQLDPSVFVADLPSPNCSEIPYPFGLSFAKHLEGFEVDCNYTSGAVLTLPLRTGSYQIQEISLEGFVSIVAGVISRRCYDTSGENVSRGTGWIDLEGSPYTLSHTRNKLTAIGCDDIAVIRRPGGGDGATSGCVSFCDSRRNVIGGSCSGLGCCQAAIPEGLKSFELRFERIMDEKSLGARSFNICSEAFFVDREFFNFSVANLFSSFPGETYHLMVLEWAIGNETCAEARNNMTAYACKDNSYCYESPSGVGYRCNCSQGYVGNPYVKGGCTDINECDDPGTNPCVGECINTPGNVSCVCPRGTSGDGRKQGSGCRSSSRTLPLKLALGMGLGLLPVIFIGIFWFYWGLKKRKLIKMRANFFQQNGGLLLQQQVSSRGITETSKIFTVEELEKATDDFNEGQILGRGGSGIVYKGVLPGDRVVAIKKSRLVDENQNEQFINEVVILSQINHRNVVKLLGCCLETQVPLLVYEFISNGTLFHLIHSRGSAYSLPWEDRLRIAAETAGALAYLHSAASVPIIHRDVKSANILLDENYTAKVSDFGASRSVPFDQTHVTTLIQGTLGYLDPEYFHTSQLTEKSDVYSFGVVLVELLTGEMPVSFARSEEQRNLAAYFVLMLDQQRLLQMMDPQIVEVAEMEQVFVVAQLARRCLNLRGEERPLMKEVAIELEGLRRFHVQQMVRRNPEELECLLGAAGPAARYASESSRQYSLESHMLASMDLPR